MATTLPRGISGMDQPYLDPGASLCRQWDANLPVLRCRRPPTIVGCRRAVIQQRVSDEPLHQSHPTSNVEVGLEALVRFDVVSLDLCHL